MRVYNKEGLFLGRTPIHFITHHPIQVINSITLIGNDNGKQIKEEFQIVMIEGEVFQGKAILMEIESLFKWAKVLKFEASPLLDTIIDRTVKREMAANAAGGNQDEQKQNIQ